MARSHPFTHACFPAFTILNDESTHLYLLVIRLCLGVKKNCSTQKETGPDSTVDRASRSKMVDQG